MIRIEKDMTICETWGWVAACEGGDGGSVCEGESDAASQSQALLLPSPWTPDCASTSHPGQEI